MANIRAQGKTKKFTKSKSKVSKEVDTSSHPVWITTNVLRLRQAKDHTEKLSDNPTFAELEREADQLQAMVEINFLLKHLYVRRDSKPEITSNAFETLNKQGMTLHKLADLQNKNSSPFN